MVTIIARSYREAFQRDGVVCIRDALTPTEIQGMRDEVDARLEQHGLGKDGLNLDSLATEVWSSRRLPNKPAEVRQLQRAVRADRSARPLRDSVPEGARGLFYLRVGNWQRSRAIRAVALDSQLPELVTDLLNSSRLHFWNDTIYAKGPFTSQKTAYHQDLPYMDADGTKCASVWIALDPVDLPRGGLKYIRGSHLWSQLYAANTLIAQTPIPGSDLPRLPDIEAQEQEYEILTFDVRPGDIIVHDARVVHGAGGNTTAQMRRAISMRYCGDDVTYFKRQGTAFQANATHTLENGSALHTKDFPVVWPRPWPQLRLSDLYSNNVS
jgi:ectoine hydroxylase-related dioxygenase (phytanoyl-CoA dioxygenase family)